MLLCIDEPGKHYAKQKNSYCIIPSIRNVQKRQTLENILFPKDWREWKCSITSFFWGCYLLAVIKNSEINNVGYTIML